MRKWAPLLVLLLVTSTWAKEKFQEPGPVRLTRDGRKWAARVLRKMTLEEKIGQMLMPCLEAGFYNADSPEFVRLRGLVRDYHVGGFCVSVRAEGQFVFLNQPYEAAMLINALQREAKVPLIFTADFERGLAMRFKATTGFPHAMAVGATGNPHYAEQEGAVTAQEARAIGVEWNFFPVADVNSNPANPIINTRSFGEDPQQVADFVAAYIRGSHQFGMLATAKHFPGHGDTSTDTHIGLATASGDKARLERVDLVPFRRAIAEGVDAVMVAHIRVPALDPDPARVASTSPAIVGLLKNDLGFHGIVLPDAMDMQGLTDLYPQPGAEALAAVEAGEDILLKPADVEVAYNALLDAVRSGKLPEARIDASVLKILEAKASVGLDRARLVDVHRLPDIIARPESLSLAQEIAGHAVTLVRNDGDVLPLKSQGTAGRGPTYDTLERAGGGLLAVVFVDDLRGDNGRTFEHELKARVPDADVIFVDRKTAAAMTGEVLRRADRADTVIAAVYVIPSAGRKARINGKLKASAEVGDAEADLLRGLLDTVPGKTVVVSLGNPYIASEFPEIETYLCTYSNMPVSEISAVRALFGELPFRGKLPVTIPGYAARGTGLALPPPVPGPPAGKNQGGSYARH